MEWCFPATNGGVSQGFKDSSQEFFRANAWQHTIREIIQNSLDAADEHKSEPVTVKLSEIMVSTSEIGGRDLASHMSKALERTKKDNDPQGIEFYKNALKVLEQDKIKALAITDRNTTGLVDEKWDTLVYNEGTTNKNMGAAGGSFGIGKNAPYLVSSIKTVCYSTRYLQRKGTQGKASGRIEKFIARCKISSHENPKPPNEDLQHIGFGTREKIEKNKRPLPTLGKNIHDQFRLDDAGSGIFIMGFDPKTSDWIKYAKESIIHNFFVALHEKKLEIYINSECINYETLDVLFQSGKKKEPSRHYYHIIRDSDIKESIEGDIGKFIIKLSTGEEHLPNKVAYVNRRGMLVTDESAFKKNPFTFVGNRWANYAAVVMAQDDKTDEKIREMEPPNHQAIEFERVNDQKKRRLIKDDLKNIQKQITDFVNRNISSNTGVNSIELPELADILTMPGKDKKNEPGHESKSISLSHHEIIPSTPSNPTNNPGESSEGGRDPRNGKSGEKKSDNGQSLLGNQGERDHNTTLLHQKRIIRNENKLHAAFTLQHDNEEPIHFKITPAGEERKNERTITINSIDVTSPSKSDVKKNGNHIIVTPKDNERVMLELETENVNEYTGYEIVEVLPTNKSTESRK